MYFILIYLFIFCLITYVISLLVYRIKHRKFLDQLLKTLEENNSHLEEILHENISLWEIFTKSLKEDIQKNNNIDIDVEFSHKNRILNILKDILNKKDWPQKVNIGFIDKLVSTITAKYDEYEEEYDIRGSIYKKTESVLKKLHSHSNVA